jgi:hypothetical protein
MQFQDYKLLASAGRSAASEAERSQPLATTETTPASTEGPFAEMSDDMSGDMSDYISEESPPTAVTGEEIRDTDPSLVESTSYDAPFGEGEDAIPTEDSHPFDENDPPHAAFTEETESDTRLHALSPERERELFLEHVRTYLGPPTLFHQSESKGVHLELHYVPPTPERPLASFITYGMSAIPLQAPPDAQQYRYAELMITLPESWPTDPGSLRSPRWAWPLNQLLFLARYPHESGNWIWLGHTIPFDDPPRPYADDTQLCCILLLPPIVPPGQFRTLQCGDKTIHLFALVPLYEEEMELKLREGSKALLPLFNAQHVNEIIVPNRPNVVASQEVDAARR